MTQRITKQAFLSELSLDQTWSAKVGLTLVGVALLTLSAKLKVPFYPVPITLQTLVVLLIALSYGRKLALTTVASYIALGAVGMPVFATGAGFAYLLGPTGGYLIGFVAATAVVAWLGERMRHRNAWEILLALTVGECLIFACGLTWLAEGVGIGWSPALAGGLYPFVTGELAKIGVAVLTLPHLMKALIALRTREH